MSNQRNPIFVPDHELDGEYEGGPYETIARWIGYGLGAILFVGMVSYIVGTLAGYYGFF